MVTLGTCHDITGKGLVPFEKMDSHSLSRVLVIKVQCKVADAHYLVSVFESTPFGEHFGLSVLVLGQGGGAQE